MLRFWADLTTEDFRSLDPEKTIAVLPIAAIEQHGPHLPVSTDTEIANGMVREVMQRACRRHLDVLVPADAADRQIQRTPALAGHADALSRDRDPRLDRDRRERAIAPACAKSCWSIRTAATSTCISIVARELRVRLGMLAVASQWSRFGSPPGLYTDQENAVGIHAGDMETSMMLHFRPDLVKMDKAAQFRAERRSRSRRRSSSCARPASPPSAGSRRTCMRQAPPAMQPCNGREGPHSQLSSARRSSSNCLTTWRKFELSRLA